MSLIRPVLETLTGEGGAFEVIDALIDGHPARTYANRLPNVRDFIAVGRNHGGKEFLVDSDHRLTFGDAFDRVLRLAGTLHERFGVGPGDRVAVIGANAADWVVAYWAGMALNAVVVPFNAWWTAEELEFGLADSGTSFVLADAKRARVAVAAGFGPARLAVWGEGDVPAGAHRVADLLATEPAPLDLTPARDEDETAVIFYTSGTTGQPKGSANTHRNIVANFLNAVSFTVAAALSVGDQPGGGDDAQDTDLCVIPLFHATANLAVMVPFVYAGNKLVFMPPGRFDAEVAGELIERERVTRFGGVPTIVARILDSGVHHRRDFSTISMISYGGAPASPALLKRVESAFPDIKSRIVQGYGLTETSAISTLNVGADYHARPNSVGIAAPVVELRIVGPDGAAVTAGQVGEVWIRGSNVIPGYWNRPEVNAETFTDGFLHTGDIGYLDEDGFLYITDRAKDMVIRGGENVYCTEVEAVLEAHPTVREVAVVGAPHSDLGEEVKAVVVPHDGVAVDPALLEAFAGEHLAAFKVPTVWEVRSEMLPRNPSGKVLKALLRGGHSATFAVGEESDSAL
jgi:long-chain acyl-CoA synthetase